jgi:hypothetical protein
VRWVAGLIDEKEGTQIGELVERKLRRLHFKPPGLQSVESDELLLRHAVFARLPQQLKDRVRRVRPSSAARALPHGPSLSAPSCIVWRCRTCAWPAVLPSGCLSVLSSIRRSASPSFRRRVHLSARLCNSICLSVCPPADGSAPSGRASSKRQALAPFAVCARLCARVSVAARLRQESRLLVCREGDAVAAAGVSPRWVYVIVRGAVHLETQTAGLKRTVSAPAVLGGLAVLLGRPRLLAVRAAAPVEVYLVSGRRDRTRRVLPGGSAGQTNGHGSFARWICLVAGYRTYDGGRRRCPGCPGSYGWVSGAVRQKEGRCLCTRHLPTNKHGKVAAVVCLLRNVDRPQPACVAPVSHAHVSHPGHDDGRPCVCPLNPKTLILMSPRSPPACSKVRAKTTRKCGRRPGRRRWPRPCLCFRRACCTARPTPTRSCWRAA